MRSGNAHGLHSPFVYSLYAKGLKNKISRSQFDAIEALREDFLNDSTEIEIKDFGAGSQTMKSGKRKIKSIAKNSVSGKRKCEILFRLVNYLEAKRILELGSSLGISTAYLKLGNPKSEIISVEADENLVTIASRHLKNGVILLNEKFDNALNSEPIKSFNPDLVFIDGDHRGASLLNYVDILKKNTEKDCCIVIDDIYWSEDMNKAWLQLKEDQRFGISIDLFHVGMLFTHEKLVKQHFDLRF